MHTHVKGIIEFAWAAAGVVWVIGGLAAKRTVRAQSGGSCALHLALAVAAFALGFTKYFQFGFFIRAFVPASPAFAYAGMLLATGGIAFAIWARFCLGTNWSGTVTVKENHSLVKRGPYAIVRHPIYSGALGALIGTAIAWREVRVLAAAGLVFSMVIMKMIMEEQFMMEQFGADYREYARQVKALIPFVY